MPNAVPCLHLLCCSVCCHRVPRPAPCAVSEPDQRRTPDEADPAYPDAAAIYLYRESKADDTLHHQSEHVRIKVLKESGKELATVNLGYFRGTSTVEGVSGRTIHADRTVIPLNVKPEDLLSVKQGQAEIHEVVFNLPSVEVGSILEYYYRIIYDPNLFSSPRWEIQQRFPVRKAHFSFIAYPAFFESGAGMRSQQMIDYRGNPLTDLTWYVNLPHGKTLTPDARGHFNLDLTDIPPLPTEQWMPPIESQRYQVIFYYTPGKSGVDYWLNESNYWLKDVSRFSELNSAIKQAAAEIVAPAIAKLTRPKSSMPPSRPSTILTSLAKKPRTNESGKVSGPQNGRKTRGRRRAAAGGTSQCSILRWCGAPA